MNSDPRVTIRLLVHIYWHWHRQTRLPDGSIRVGRILDPVRILKTWLVGHASPTVLQEGPTPVEETTRSLRHNDWLGSRDS